MDTDVLEDDLTRGMTENERYMHLLNFVLLQASKDYIDSRRSYHAAVATFASKRKSTVVEQALLGAENKFLEIQRWFTDEEKHPFGCAWICSILGYEQDKMLKKLEAYSNQLEDHKNERLPGEKALRYEIRELSKTNQRTRSQE